LGLANTPAIGHPLAETIHEAKIKLVYKANNCYRSTIPDFDVFSSPDLSLVGRAAVPDFTVADRNLVEEIGCNVGRMNFLPRSS